MRVLLLMRHAKSSWRDVGLDDHERPLNRRGQRSATFMGELIAEKGLVPDLIVSSTAVRAVETANGLISASGYDGPMEVRRRLYMAEPPTCFDVLSEVPHGTESVLLIGHNPCVAELVSILTEESPEMPTAALVRIELDVDEIADIDSSTSGRLTNFYRPPKEDKKKKKKKK